MRFWILLWLLCCLGMAQPASANDQCGADGGIELAAVGDAPWKMRIQLNPKDVPLNAPFDAIVSICSQSGQMPSRLTVDATMPAHKHGMNYEPKTEQVAERRYQTKNLLFHMPGIWRLEVTAYQNTTPHRFTLDVDLQ